jgi:hypothetical protein
MLSQNAGLPLNAIIAQMRFLQGSVLTIVDASYSNPEQNKAVKDLIKQSFRDKMNWIGQLVAGKDNGGELRYCDRILGTTEFQEVIEER